MTGPSEVDASEVVVLRIPAQIIRDQVRELGLRFSGWKVWHCSWSGTWNAYREGERPYFGSGSIAGCQFMVSALDAAGLVALLEDQVRIDLTMEFPDWGVRQSVAGWYAVSRDKPGTDAGSVTQFVHCPGIADLQKALRARRSGQVPERQA